MSGVFRTATGGRVDRHKPIGFTFDGQRYFGLPGDTLASALLANGVHLVGRSFKYHRPRGILSAGSEEPNALVTVIRDTGRTTPNLRATTVELYEGLVAESQNRWPSLARDVGAINDRLGKILPAGFYYKTFMGPTFMSAGVLGANTAWTKLYEPLIRRAAGLGRAPTLPDPDHYASQYAYCDVLVIGSGPAGLAAAVAATNAGARVILCDEQAEFGGSLLGETVAGIDGHSAQQWLGETVAALQRQTNVALLPRTTAFGYFHENMVALAERVTDHLSAPDTARPREKLWQVFTKEVVLATGAIERPLVFADNDRPGIMLAGAGIAYLERYGVKAGHRAVIAGSDDTIYQAALACRRHGVAVAGILDSRPEATSALAQEALDAAISVTTSATIIGTTGRLRVATVHVGQVDGHGRVRDAGQLACDHVLMSGGWTPAVHLFSQSRGKLRFHAARDAFLPGASHARERSAGACAGVEGLGEVLASGFAAGENAATAAGLKATTWTTVRVTDAAIANGVAAHEWPHGRDAASVKAFVDFQNDVTSKDLRLAAQEGFRSIEHVKRYTTTGMATDQGKTSNMNALGIVAATLNTPLPAIGLTTFRQPYTPVTFGTLAGHNRGDLFDPVRRTGMDGWAQQRGAVFEDVGQWKRARYFPRSGENMHRAVDRECKAVRAAVGMFDASTLGKIEVVGPDAAEFLERLYVNPFHKLGIGRCRYGLLLNEAGFVIDDGVIGRLATDRFHVTTTTGGAARVLHMMEDYRQTEFPDLKAWLTSTTEQWAVIAVQGPKARDVLSSMLPPTVLDPATLPHMGLIETTIRGIPARVFRVSFTGEAGYEINVPTDYGAALWQALWPAVETHNGVAYGTEAMHVLRAEKGFIIVGQETDGTVTPDDVGLGWAIGKNKKDFVGKRGLAMPDLIAPGRRQLVGLRTVDSSVILEEGAQITAQPSPPTGTPALGHVTSSYWSTTMGSSIALALVAGGRKRLGETLYVPMPNGGIAVRVVSPTFYDWTGERTHG